MRTGPSQWCASRWLGVEDTTDWCLFWFSCRSILQLALVELGITSMRSDQPQSYYKCLLANKLVQPLLGDKTYTAVLQNRPLPALPAPAAVPLPAPEPAAPDMDSDSGELLEVLDVIPPIGAHDHALALPPGGESGSDSSSAPDEIVHSLVIDPVPLDLDGARLRFEASTHGYDRYIITCRYHHGCMKHRNRGRAQCKNFGAWEPLAFLAVWESRGMDCEPGEHVDLIGQPRVTLEEVQDWLRAHGK